MALHVLAEMTWEEVRSLDRAQAVAVLPVGAVEAHGPHLPLATDVLIAEAMARAAARRLSLEVLLLPALVYSAAGYAAGFPGTISVAPASVTSIVVDVARSLAAQGVRRLALANAHLDPTHLRSLHAAVEAARDVMTVVFPDLTRKPWALRLTDEFKSGACHAGRFEGSIVLAERPDLVREAIRKALPANPASLSQAIRRGQSTFEEAGGPRAYFGDPAAASAEEGRAILETLGSILADAIVNA